MQPGRNDPCPCGSGKKYKKCCGVAAAATPRTDISALLARAEAAFKRGLIAEAQLLCADALKIAPGHPGVHHLHGLVRYRLGNLAAARESFEKAAALAPGNAIFHINLACVLQEQGDHAAAIRHAQRAVVLTPSSAEAHSRLANSLLASGAAEAAVAQYREALALDPANVTVRTNLGGALRQQGSPEEAEQILRAVLEVAPAFPPALANLGALHLQRKHHHEARDLLARALELNPSDLTALINLGLAEMGLGDLVRAENCFERAIERSPGFAAAYVSKGMVQVQAGRLDEAERSYKKALSLDPGLVGAHKNLVAVLKAKHDYTQAHALVIQAAADPRHAMEVLPDALTVFGAVADIGRQESTWQLLLRLYKTGALDDSVRDRIVPSANYSDLIPEPTVVGLHRAWGEALQARTAGERIVAYPRPVPHERLRVGYLSPDFRRHSVGYWIQHVIANHDKARFEIFCYANFRETDSDDITRFIGAHADRFRHIFLLDDIALSRLIQEDEIDVLVDLAGHTDFGRLAVFALTPAPVQISWLGYPNTTGLPSMDFRVSDPHADPEDANGYTERFLRLPECFLSFGAFPELEIRRAPPCADNGYVTFGSFNMLWKINRSVVRLWGRILERVPGSRLMIKAMHADLEIARRDLTDAFAEVGIDPQRLILRGWDRSSESHLMQYNDIDVALDTFPYAGTTTTAEALWMGVPVVTLAGSVHRQRVGYSILKNVGLEEFVAWTADDYTDIAAGLAYDPERLQRLRLEIRERMQRFDPLQSGAIHPPTRTGLRAGVATAAALTARSADRGTAVN
jgi:predicted O-linked N-acetylglucosamine transferase (SPINDLY family)